MQWDKEYTVSLIVGAIINFCVNLHYDSQIRCIWCCCWNIVFRNCVNEYSAFLCSQELPLKKYCQNCCVFVLIGMVMYGTVYTMKKQLDCTALSLIVLVLIGGAVYCCLTWLYLSFTKNELAKEIRKQVLEMTRRK